MRRFFLLYVVVFLTALSLSAISGAKQANLKQEYALEIAQSETLGSLIYAKDIAAWVATDKMIEELGANLQGLPLKGWVIEQEKDSKNWRVSFFGERKHKTAIYYQVWVEGQKITKSQINRDGLKPNAQQIAMWRARQDALHRLNNGDYLRCSKSYNTVIIPYEYDLGGTPQVGMYVYLFSATKKSGEAVIGGHHRLDYSADGKRLNGHLAFTRSCMAFNTRAKDGKMVEALFMTHLQSSYPLEHHVFVSLSFQSIPFYVMTQDNSALWSVEKGKVRYIPMVKTDKEKNK